MENEKDIKELQAKLEAKLEEMREDIKNASDQELEMMGMENYVMLQMLAKENGKDHPHTQASLKLMGILKTEFLRRQDGDKPKPVIVTEKTPSTFNELMALGDGNAEEIEMVKKT
jgi:hypothetical protein